MNANKHDRKVTEIPADPFGLFAESGETKKSHSQKDSDSGLDLPFLKKKRVAAYARVSTDQEEQEGSFLSQVSFYAKFIDSHANWQLVKIYADKGLSGTSFKRRPQFNQMLADAESGKIDLILTKSISRFARNTVDSLSVTRQLKGLGVEVFFEKENISSFDDKAELMFTILSSIAQEESRSISENVRWGKLRSMEAGKVSLPYKNFLGYRKGKDGYPEVVEEEAKIIRKIYQLFLDGVSYREIARILTNEGILTPSRRLVWNAQSIRSILTNEKYKGAAILGKTYIDSFLTKRVKVNHGERKKFYVEKSHEAIISPEIFDRVQQEIKSRKRKKSA